MEDSNRIAAIAAIVAVTITLALWQPTIPSAAQDLEVTQPIAATAAQATKPSEAPTVAPPQVTGVSSKSITYARSIGGTSHEGKTLYFVIGASVKSEDDAQSKLEHAIPIFGDMQSYFIVQNSDNFGGMKPGWWVIVEAYNRKPSKENLDFAKRAFPDAFVRKAIVRTSDPIPVYEELVAQ
jgi:hypothetical protein